MVAGLPCFGRYRVEGELGSGGMAVVYRAHDEDLDRVVAIKLLADNLAGDAAFRERFLREARLTARLRHPNIVQIYDTGEHDGRPFIVMEYVAGESLAERLAREGSPRRWTAYCPVQATSVGLGEERRYTGLKQRLLTAEGSPLLTGFPSGC
jgi:serine/threonine protein kinase